jgi:hypothetical protein
VLVIIVMATLTAGWPLLNRAVSDRQRIAPDSTLILGPSQSAAAAITVGPGWSLVTSQTDPHEDYALRRGVVALTMTYVSLLNGRQVTDLWAGLRMILKISHPGVSLGPPAAFTTSSGRRGLIGTLSSPAIFGTATVVAAPRHGFAVEMILIAPRHVTRLNLIAAHQIIRSLHMPDPQP